MCTQNGTEKVTKEVSTILWLARIQRSWIYNSTHYTFVLALLKPPPLPSPLLQILDTIFITHHPSPIFLFLHPPSAIVEYWLHLSRWLVNRSLRTKRTAPFSTRIALVGQAFLAEPKPLTIGRIHGFGRS